MLLLLMAQLGPDREDLKAMAKLKLDARLDADLIYKIKRIEAERKIDTNAIISNALDCLERDFLVRQTVEERLENLEKFMLQLVEKLHDFCPGSY